MSSRKGQILAQNPSSSSSTHFVITSEAPHILLHHEPKLFWRERINVDICIVFSPKFNIVEVIGYNLDEEIESPRIYCDKDKLSERISALEVDARVLEFQKEASRRRTRIPATELTQHSLTQLIVDFILNRLTIRKIMKQKVHEEVKIDIDIKCERCKRCIKCLK
jgi:molybdopterin-guanine dinucleotide biosynthesis protein